jgi:putative membrane-bound dehydrogenase-like protein
LSYDPVMKPQLLAILLLAVCHPLAGAQLPAKPLPPAEAAQHMTVPEGFHVTLFAGEPDVVQPIAFTFDDRGRLWVAECFSYPQWQTDGKPGRDRILIFEDRDGDGRFDTCKVFYDKIANISGLEVGFGGVWVCATPNLLFIPDRDGDDVPDGPPQVVLDGWDLRAQHNVFNDLTWGPDGWLYGCNGILSNSTVGAPGTPDDRRTRLNCGVWRYHPTRKEFEVVATGTTNPWGLDFDDYGQTFITNCVIHHLWHVIPGAHFQRMFGQDFNPHWYSLMTSPADHIHWAGGPWQSSRGGQGKHSETGGGHAHVGAMIYLGDNWPDRYRNGVFMCNLHGNRLNHDILERHGSGYVAHHGRDFLFANDPWFRGISLHYGPDGGVFMSDWTDTGECHNYKEVDRSNGRVYKVTFGKTTPFRGDLAKLGDAALVRCQLHKNDWYVRHARRLLQERSVAGKLEPATHGMLRTILAEHDDVRRKLRALWALHVTGGVDEALLCSLLANPHEELRAWAVQLSLEGRRPAARVQMQLAAMAREDPAPCVRLALASGMQRLALSERWPIAEGLFRHGEDAGDANLPLMVWYAVEPLVAAERDRAVKLIARAQIPLVREYLARRVVLLAGPESGSGAAGLKALVDLLGGIEDSAIRRDVLRGIGAALEGRRQVVMPANWPAVSRRLAQSPSPEVREQALFLGVVFGDAHGLAVARETVMDTAAPVGFRTQALQALVYKKNTDLVPLLQGLIADRALRRAALRGLAAFSDEGTPAAILRRYASFTDDEKADAIQTLASRPSYALMLLAAIERGQVPRRDVSAFTVRQLLGLNHKAVSDKLGKVWGTIRPASQEKAALMARYKSLLTPEYLKSADVARGRAVYARTCASCHRLFGEGGDVGPELTGSQRGNLDYLLENILDPSAIVPTEYQVTILATKDGRVLTGIIKQENDKTVTVRTQNESVIVPKEEIEERHKSALSMMPEGLLGALKDGEVRDLVAYLGSAVQVALPKK